MAEITLYNEDNFHDFEHYQGISLIRFYADWCAPCIQSTTTFQRLAEKLDVSIKVGQVNTDQSPILTLRYNVFGLPSILLFQDTVLVKRMTGLQPMQHYLDTIQQLQQA